MGRRCGLTGSTVGTAGQRKQDAAEIRRGRIRSTGTIWRVHGNSARRPVHGRCGPVSSIFYCRTPQRGVYVKPANNEVEDGIRVVGIALGKAEHPDQQGELQGTARRDAVLRLGRQGGRAGRGKAREAERSRPGCVKVLLLYGPSKVADRGIGGS